MTVSLKSLTAVIDLQSDKPMHTIMSNYSLILIGSYLHDFVRSTRGQTYR